MNLYLLNLDIETLLNVIYNDAEENHGEINEKLFYQVHELQCDKNTIIENLALECKNLESNIKAFDDEVKNLQDRQIKQLRKLSSIKKYLSETFTEDKLETPKVKLSWRKSERLDIVDEGKIPQKYITEVVEIKISKNDIKKDIKNGVDLSECAKIIECKNLQIK